jgi:hypothetical protein
MFRDFWQGKKNLKFFKKYLRKLKTFLKKILLKKIYKKSFSQLCSYSSASIRSISHQPRLQYRGAFRSRQQKIIRIH